MKWLDIQRNFKYWIIVLILIFADAVSSWIAYDYILLPHLKNSSASDSVLIIAYFLILIIWAILFFLDNRYRVDPTISRFAEIQSIFRITIGVTILLVFYNELVELPIAIPSSAILQYWFVFILLVSIGRLGIRQIQKFFLKRGIGAKNTLIVGVNARAAQVAQHLETDHLGYNVIGYINPHNNESETDIAGPIVSTLSGLQEAIKDYKISEVIIALEKPNHDRLLDILTLANGSPASMKIIPDMYEVVSGLAKTEQTYGLPLIQINPEIMTISQQFFKRVIDIIVASMMIVLFAPVWIMIALAIKISSKGPILYRQERIGFNGQRFFVIKFRSMVVNAESGTGPVWAKEDDPRVTKVGSILRRFRLDEIPQFLNVLKGDMSVVGPRPERPYFVEKLMEEFPFYYRRFKVRPGITGWAQIKHSYDKSIEDVRQKLKYDFFYIENISLALDLNIILNTIIVMVSGKGH